LGFVTALVIFICLQSVFASITTKIRSSIRSYFSLTPTPTINRIILPSNMPTKEPEFNLSPTISINKDPIISCSISVNCGGEVRRIKKSICTQLVCCQIGKNWYLYQSKIKCDQNQAIYNAVIRETSKGTKNILPTWKPLPTFTPLPTFKPFPTLKPGISSPGSTETKTPVVIEPDYSRLYSDCVQKVNAEYNKIMDQLSATGVAESSIGEQAQQNKIQGIDLCQRLFMN